MAVPAPTCSAAGVACSNTGLGAAASRRSSSGTAAAIINVLSVLSWITLPALATYSVSKAAAWALTNGLRAEVAGQGTQVVALHVGYMDTDMGKHAPEPKSSPDDVVRQTLDALERGELEVLADEVSRQVKAGLSASEGVYLGNVSR